MSSHRQGIGRECCICALRRGIAVCAVCVVPAFSAATEHASFVLPNGSSAQAAKTVSFAASRYPLVQTFWDGSSHLTSRYISIGGYARYQPFGYEMLLDFDVPDLGSEIIDARINVKIAENTTNSSQRLFLYAQDKDSAWDSSTVTYDTFGREPWDDILAVAVVPDSRVSEVAFSGGALTARINRWMKDPESNRGLIVTGGFGHWDSYVIADSVTVELVYGDQTDSSTTESGEHARIYSRSFEQSALAESATVHGNRIGTCLESRLVYARKSLVSGNRSVLFGGVVTSEGNIAIGADARVSADLHAFGDVELFNRASVKGDVRAGDDIVMHPEASISAQTVTQEDGEIPSCSMLSDGPWPESYQDVSVPLDTTTELSPGSYRDLSTAYGYRPAILRLRHGVYSFRNIRWFSAGRIEADLSGGDIEVYVSDSLLLGYSTVVSAVNSAFANELTFHVLGDAEVSDDARVAANIVSDEANVRIGNRVLVEGRIVGGRVVIGEDCVVSAPRAFEPSSRFASYDISSLGVNYFSTLSAILLAGS